LFLDNFEFALLNCTKAYNFGVQWKRPGANSRPAAPMFVNIKAERVSLQPVLRIVVRAPVVLHDLVSIQMASVVLNHLGIVRFRHVSDFAR
jgi:hypothetical protein